MNNPINIQSFLDSKIPMLLIVEEILNNWKGDKCLQLPDLLGQLKAKMDWDDKQLRSNDPIVREYIRNHSNWTVRPGAGGGIMRAVDKQKKAELIEAKRKAKEEISLALDAEVARKISEATAKEADLTETNDIDSE